MKVIDSKAFDADPSATPPPITLLPPEVIGRIADEAIRDLVRSTITTGLAEAVQRAVAERLTPEAVKAVVEETAGKDLRDMVTGQMRSSSNSWYCADAVEKHCKALVQEREDLTERMRVAIDAAAKTMLANEKTWATAQVVEQIRALAKKHYGHYGHGTLGSFNGYREDNIRRLMRVLEVAVLSGDE